MFENDIHDSQGEDKQALKYYRKALTLFERKLGSEHPYTKTVRNNIARISEKLNQ